MILSAQDFDSLYHLGSVPVTYSPRDINTEAIQATRENIGAISVELRSELRYESNDSARPYCVVVARRATEEEPDKAPSRYFLNLGDWIVVLWDEIHVFHDYEFKHTFNFVSPKPAHLLAETVQLEQREEDVKRGSLAFDHDEVNPR